MATSQDEADRPAMEDDDTDALLAELEAETDDTNSAVYQQRLSELQANAVTSRPTLDNRKETCLDLKSDDETLQFTTEHAKAVVHFRHPDFARCAIMDEHLDAIAQKHSNSEASGEDLAFARVDVTNTPFIVEKLGIRVLPCLIGFAAGIVKGKVVGFEGVCWDSNEKSSRVTKTLEATIFSWGLLSQKLLASQDDSDSDEGEADDKFGQNNFNPRRGIKNSKARVTGLCTLWEPTLEAETSRSTRAHGDIECDFVRYANLHATVSTETSPTALLSTVVERCPRERRDKNHSWSNIEAYPSQLADFLTPIPLTRPPILYSILDTVAFTEIVNIDQMPFYAVQLPNLNSRQQEFLDIKRDLTIIAARLRILPIPENHPAEEKKLQATKGKRRSKDAGERSKLLQMPAEIMTNIFRRVLENGAPLRKAIQHPDISRRRPSNPNNPAPIVSNINISPELLSVCKRINKEYTSMFKLKNSVEIIVTTDSRTKEPIFLIMGKVYERAGEWRYGLRDKDGSGLPPAMISFGRFHVRFELRQPIQPPFLYQLVPAFSRAVAFCLFKTEITLEFENDPTWLPHAVELIARPHVLSLMLLRCTQLEIISNLNTPVLRQLYRSLELEATSTRPPIDVAMVHEAARTFFDNVQARFLPSSRRMVDGQWFRAEMASLNDRAANWDYPGFLLVHRGLMDMARIYLRHMQRQEQQAMAVLP